MSRFVEFHFADRPVYIDPEYVAAFGVSEPCYSGCWIQVATERLYVYESCEEIKAMLEAHTDKELKQ